MRSADGGLWCPLGDSDLADVADLGRRVLAVDSGLPLVGEEAFVSGRYLGAGGRAVGVRAGDGELVAAAGVRLVRAAGSGELSRAVATAMVDPKWRGRGLGGQALDWGLAVGAEVGSGPVTVETESLTAAAGVLFESRGLRQVFAEDVMRFDLGAPVPAVEMPVGVTLASWTPELAGRFFAVYEAAFRDRPGFPGWSAERWIEWISGDEEFRPEWTVLATESSGGTESLVGIGSSGGVGSSDGVWSSDGDDAGGGGVGGESGRAARVEGGGGVAPSGGMAASGGVSAVDGGASSEGAAGASVGVASSGGAVLSSGGEDVGFVACAAGWIVQVGVRPDRRGRRLGAALVTEALRRMREDGASEALLDVNVDNPAGRLYERLGFTVVGRRAQFRQAS